MHRFGKSGPNSWRFWGIEIFVILTCAYYILRKKVLYWAPEKGEYGTKRLFRIEVYKKYPQAIINDLPLLLVIILIYLLLRWLYIKFKNDWLR